MARFLDLPLDVLPLIMQHLVRPSHLAAVCLVSKYFLRYTIPQLYESAYIYAWHKEGKVKVVKLFKTLAEYPALATFVRRLVIRDFPKALQSSAQEDVMDSCLQGIKNCVNLQSCTWTRDGSLTSEMLETLLLSQQLEELEINGAHQGHYDPCILPRFTHLRRLSLIMPSNAVINMLPAWTQATGHTLRHLSVICKSSTAVTDRLLETLGPHLSNLDHLYLVGCRKVTEEGLLALLSSNYIGLSGLGLEGVSPAFNMERFSQRCVHMGALSRLSSITLAVHTDFSRAPSSVFHDPAARAKAIAAAAPDRALDVWEENVLALLASAPLEQFHISTVGGDVGPSLTNTFCERLVSAHGERLRRFSVYRMRMSLDAIADVCRRCLQLEQLFVVVDQREFDALGPCLAHARKLRTIHVNRPLLRSGDVPVVSRERILSIVLQCPPTVTQFGSNTRVYQVERVPAVQEDGTVTVEVRLGSYESPEVPEQFLVVRT